MTTEYTCGVCRESDSKPWQVYIATPETDSAIYPANAQGLMDCLIFNSGFPAGFLLELVDEFKYAMAKNGAEQ